MESWIYSPPIADSIAAELPPRDSHQTAISSGHRLLSLFISLSSSPWFRGAIADLAPRDLLLALFCHYPCLGTCHLLKTASRGQLVGQRMKKLFFIVAFLQLGLALLCAPGTVRAQPPYSAADFVGTWGFGVSGTVIFTPRQRASRLIARDGRRYRFRLQSTERLVGDGHGVLTGTQTFNAGGLTCSGTLKGTYTVAVGWNRNT